MSTKPGVAGAESLRRSLIYRLMFEAKVIGQLIAKAVAEGRHDRAAMLKREGLAYRSTLAVLLKQKPTRSCLASPDPVRAPRHPRKIPKRIRAGHIAL